MFGCGSSPNWPMYAWAQCLAEPKNVGYGSSSDSSILGLRRMLDLVALHTHIYLDSTLGWAKKILNVVVC
jgi:hypothetical protein